MKPQPLTIATILEPGFLPLDQAARWMGVSSRTIKRWIQKGLPKHQAGPRSKVLIRRGDLEEFLTRTQCTPVLETLVEEVFKDIQMRG